VTGSTESRLAVSSHFSLSDGNICALKGKFINHNGSFVEDSDDQIKFQETTAASVAVEDNEPNTSSILDGMSSD